MSRNSLSKFDELRKGDHLSSNNREYKAVFQEDGNFVIYGWKPVWASDTCGATDAYRLCMQGDCNFVMYKKNDSLIWNTNTVSVSSFNLCHLYLRDDGVLVLDKDGQEMWNSSKSRGEK